MRSILRFRPRLRRLTAALILGALAGGCGPHESHRAVMPLFAHPGSCGDCHGSDRQSAPDQWTRGDFPRDRLCADSGCHTDLTPAGTFVHGPVATGDCTYCHVPHSSSVDALLARPEANLCASCHASLATCPSRSRSVDAPCSTCHDPHASAERHLLRASYVSFED